MRSHLKNEVQDLVWAVVDEYATESQVHRLEQLVASNAEARRTYITCMQMHADLCLLLGGNRLQPKLPKDTPVGRKKAGKPAPIFATGNPGVTPAVMC